MNLRILFYFTTLAEVRSFTRAAKKLHISQPSLSYAIKQLEKNTDTTLFERHEGGVILTDIGQQFFNISKELLAHYDEALTEFETIKETDRKSTRLNSSHVAISYAVFCLKKKIKKHIE